jgi:hypothetical protein
VTEVTVLLCARFRGEEGGLDLEELTRLSDADLRDRINAALQTLEADRGEYSLSNAQFYLSEIERRTQAKEREEQGRIATRDFRLELIVIVLIGLEIIIGVWGIVAGYREAGKQDVAFGKLKDSVDALNVSTNNTAENINKLTQAQDSALIVQKKSLATISSMNSAMKGQLDVLRADQKQAQQQQGLSAQQLETMRSQAMFVQKQWERANQSPSLLVISNNYILQPDGTLFLEYLRPKATRLSFPLSIRNVGTATAHRPIVRVDVELPSHVDCLVYRGAMQTSDIEQPCQVPTPVLPDISPDPDVTTNHKPQGKESDLNLFVSVTVPVGATEFTLRYSVSAENASASVYSLHIKLD